MKDRVYIEVPKDYRERIRELRGEPLIVDVNRVLTEKDESRRETPKQPQTASSKEVKTFAKDLHTQLEKDKKRGKK